MRKARWRSLSLLALVAVVGGLFGSGPVHAAETKVLTGTIEVVEYKIEVPDNWNGTLLLWNHGGIQPCAPNPAVDAFTGTNTWLLDHGYALAGSAFSVTGWTAAVTAQRENIALLDYFASAIGKPKRTIAWGPSLGGTITAPLAQRYPERFDAALPMSGNIVGGAATWYLRLDTVYVIKMLLPEAANLEIVSFSDVDSAVADGAALVDGALATPEGRARVALAAAVGNIPGWSDPRLAPPALDDYLGASDEPGDSDQDISTRFKCSSPR